MREIMIRGSQFATEFSVHAWIEREFGFPGYYGRNLSALADCLGDISRPTRVVLDLAHPQSDEMAAYLRRVARVFERIALVNPSLEVFVERPHAR